MRESQFRFLCFTKCVHKKYTKKWFVSTNLQCRIQND